MREWEPRVLYIAAGLPSLLVLEIYRESSVLAFLAVLATLLTAIAGIWHPRPYHINIFAVTIPILLFYCLLDLSLLLTVLPPYLANHPEAVKDFPFLGLKVAMICIGLLSYSFSLYLLIAGRRKTVHFDR